MGFFDKIKETASNVGGKVKETSVAIGDKSKVAIEKSKIKNEISKENSTIKEQYSEIGKKYFELFGDNPTDEFAPFIDKINASRDNISKLNSKLAELDDYVVCSCGAKVPKNVAFCSNCGSAIVVPTIDEDVVIVKESVSDVTQEPENEVFIDDNNHTNVDDF
ncbi:MAG: zinc ribbon domain-containing protein [Oscillospiraceae bacterium]